MYSPAIQRLEIHDEDAGRVYFIQGLVSLACSRLSSWLSSPCIFTHLPPCIFVSSLPLPIRILVILDQHPPVWLHFTLITCLKGLVPNSGHCPRSGQGPRKGFKPVPLHVLPAPWSQNPSICIHPYPATGCPLVLAFLLCKYGWYWKALQLGPANNKIIH